MNLKKGIMMKFHAERIEKRLLLENNYIMDLWSRIPVHKSSDSKDDDGGDDNDLITLKRDRPAKIFSTHRANTLEELYSKLDAIKGKKLKYKEKLIKRGLKNKLDKKKKRDERRKKTFMKGNKESKVVQADIKPEPSQPAKPAKPVFNSEGNIVFSKFDFAESPASDPGTKKGTNDPHKLLKKIEKQKEKLKELEDKGEIEKVSVIKEKEVWKKALQKTMGVKVKDDPKLLEKTIKKKTQQKKRSKAKWEAREKNVQKKIEERQQKRKANIEQKQKQRKSKKLKRLVKKGRVIPGVTS